MGQRNRQGLGTHVRRRQAEGGVAKSAMCSFSHFRKAPLMAPVSHFCLQAFALVPSHHKVIPSQGPTLVWALLSHEHKALHSSYMFLP